MHAALLNAQTAVGAVHLSVLLRKLGDDKQGASPRQAAVWCRGGLREAKAVKQALGHSLFPASRLLSSFLIQCLTQASPL